MLVNRVILKIRYHIINTFKTKMWPTENVSIVYVWISEHSNLYSVEEVQETWVSSTKICMSHTTPGVPPRCQTISGRCHGNRWRCLRTSTTRSLSNNTGLRTNRRPVFGSRRHRGCASQPPLPVSPECSRTEEKNARKCQTHSRSLRLFGSVVC